MHAMVVKARPYGETLLVKNGETMSATEEVLAEYKRGIDLMHSDHRFAYEIGLYCAGISFVLRKVGVEHELVLVKDLMTTVAQDGPEGPEAVAQATGRLESPNNVLTA